MKRDFKGVIWTNHALERMRERGIKQGDAWVTFNSPHSSKKASTKGAYIYYKTFGNNRIEVVAKKEEDKWIILSVWSKEIDGKKHESALLKLLKKLFN